MCIPTTKAVSSIAAFMPQLLAPSPAHDKTPANLRFFANKRSTLTPLVVTLACPPQEHDRLRNAQKEISNKKKEDSAHVAALAARAAEASKFAAEQERNKAAIAKAVAQKV